MTDDYRDPVARLCSAVLTAPLSEWRKRHGKRGFINDRIGVRINDAGLFSHADCKHLVMPVRSDCFGGPGPLPDLLARLFEAHRARSGA